MKKPLALVVLLFCLATPVKAEVFKRVVVYQDMAYVTLEKEAVNHAVIIDAPPDFIPASLAVTPVSGGVIAGLEIEPQRAVSGKARQIQELLVQKKAQQTALKRQQTTLEKEIEIIYDAAGATRKEAAFPRQRMVEALAFIDERVNALNTKHIRLGREIDELGAQIKDLEEQAQQLSQRQGYRITITADGMTRVSYAVRKAFWKPEYAVYALPGKGTLTLESSARIWQSTGMDWEAKEVLVSTGRPGIGIQAPEVSPWYIAAPQPVGRMLKGEAAMMAAPAELAADEEPAVQATTTSYVIGAAASVTLPGDGTPRSVRLQRKNLPASYSRLSIPKLNQAAFLRAACTWEGNAPITPGGYTAFVDGEFCGRGELKAVQPGEKMTVDLGRDEGLKVERKEEVFHDKTITGKDRTTYTCRIMIANTRADSIALSLKDQIPVSQDEEITVELLKTDPRAAPDKEGIMTWEITCPAHAQTVVSFSFSVTGRMPHGGW